MATPVERINRILDPLKAQRTHPGKFSLDKMRTLLQRLGQPQKRIPPAIHVAGTNGKGSLAAFLRAMCEAAGLRVHMTISPDLVRVNERIYLAGHDIETELMADLLEEVAKAGESIAPQHFELITAAAFLAFSRIAGDVVLLETGLGGRLDATNLVDRPAAAAITPISFDHMEFLGDTLAKIAAEKAEIMKPGRPAVIGPQPPEAAAIFDAKAAEISAPLFRYGREWRAWKEPDDRLGYESAQGKRLLPRPGLLGDYQYPNAGTAIACLEACPELKVPESAIATGLGTVRWPARLQHLTRGPLVERLPAGWELWLDGTHNEGGAEVVAATLRTWPRRPLHLVFATQKNRRPQAVFRPFLGLVDTVHGVAIPDLPSSHEPEGVAAAARTLGLPATASPSVAAALADIVAKDGPDSRILICGSLYLAGSVLAENG
ncbi:MAG: bifunctional folylpolyglutamate synthase/dihydrofolate synthase [Alphaproteobacteria bacterium]|nr:bifunctional folylpolyglutamate synthase/dihydrofolate synthase [Alphaproteobacteria bacterium]